MSAFSCNVDVATVANYQHKATAQCPCCREERSPSETQVISVPTDQSDMCNWLFGNQKELVVKLDPTIAGFYCVAGHFILNDYGS